MIRISRVLLAALALSAVLLTAAASAAEKVTITRDSRGEPHIKANSGRGATYGFAWAQMEDQAPAVLELINHAVGRSAERIGAGCTPALQACFRQDQLAHLFRVPESAYERYGFLPAESRSRLAAFAAGINDYIDSGAANLPAWAVHVTPQDVLANVEYRFIMAQVSQVNSILQGGGVGGDDDAADLAARTAGPGSMSAGTQQFDLPASNMFALSGRKTRSGEPILQGDPHLPWDGTSRWYAAQLTYPGVRVQGITFRGLPGLAIGSNRHLAWSHTANHNAQHEQDGYLEVLNPGNPSQYMFGGSYRNMDVRRVPIAVKLADGTVRTVTVTLRETHHGPVLSDPPANLNGTQPTPNAALAIAAKVSEYRQVQLATQQWQASEARSVREFRTALALNQLSAFNTLVADDRGTIFFVASSRSGILAPGRGFNTIFNGTDPANDWQGILPFDALPKAENPTSGYLQNANNAPWFTAPDQIREADLPFYLRGGGDTSRSRRLVQLLGSQTTLGPPRTLTVSDTERIGMDTFVEFGPSLRALLRRAADSPGASMKVKEAAALIDAWPGARDLFATTGSTAYPLFATWRRGLRQGVLHFNPTNPPPPTTDFTPAQEAEASRAMVVAYDGMKAQYGSIAVPYGALHTFTWGSFTASVNGGDDGLATVRLTNCKSDPDSDSPVFYHPCATQGGSSHIFNVDLATQRFTVSRPVSDTDNPASPFYTLNARDYAADHYREFPVTDGAAKAQATSQKTLNVP